MTRGLPFKYYKILLFFLGALKTDHTEVLLSADFTGAIKVFINLKKYWAPQMLSALHVQACRTLALKLEDSHQGHLTSPNYLKVIALRHRAVCSLFRRTGTLKRKTMERWMKWTRSRHGVIPCHISNFLIPSNCESVGIKKKKRQGNSKHFWFEQKLVCSGMYV